MAKALTKKYKVHAEQKRISKLTERHEAYFKIILSHQIEHKYSLLSLYKNRAKYGYTKQQLSEIQWALCDFLDKTVHMTITDVENEFGRKRDKRDGTFDPETESEVEITHLCLYKKADRPKPKVDQVRLHGYFRANGYFVVTRLDWYHKVHAT